MNRAQTHSLSLPAAMLERGFWLYVWRVNTPKGEMLYVGRTGDASSPNATAPYTRMSQHLGFQKNQSALRNHLTKNSIDPDECTSFELISHGPIYPEIEKPPGISRDVLMEQHKPIRDLVAAMERQLADDLKSVGYNVLNVVRSTKTFDPTIWKLVLEAFSEHFPNLRVVR